MMNTNENNTNLTYDHVDTPDVSVSNNDDEQDRNEYISFYDGDIFKTSVRVHIYDINSNELLKTKRKTECMDMNNLMLLLDADPDEMTELNVEPGKFKFKSKSVDNPCSDWWDENIEYNNHEYDEDQYIFDIRIVSEEE